MDPRAGLDTMERRIEIRFLGRLARTLVTISATLLLTFYT
jgi:hypothetical protein